MKDLEVKFRHIVYNRDIGIKSLVNESKRILKKFLKNRHFFFYEVPGLCKGIKRDGNEILVVTPKNQDINWEDPGCPLSDMQKIDILITRFNKKFQETLNNIEGAYNKGMKVLVKRATQELSEYFKSEQYINCYVPNICDGFGCSGENQYYVTLGDEKIAWDDNSLNNTQRMLIYNKLKDIIY